MAPGGGATKQLSNHIAYTNKCIPQQPSSFHQREDFQTRCVIQNILFLVDSHFHFSTLS